MKFAPTPARALAGLAGAALVAGMSMPVALAADTPSGSCAAIEFIDVAGTAESSMDYNPSDLTASYIGTALAAKGVSSSDINTWVTPYPSTAAIAHTAFGMADNEGPFNSAHTFGESVALGIKAATEHMEEVAAGCPDTKFAVAGFSQGAQVAGDVSAQVSAGLVEGVTADDMVGTFLIGDPKRSGTGAVPEAVKAESTLYVPIPDGTTEQAGYELLFRGDGVTTDSTSYGVAGKRTQPFTGQYGKVFSFCNEQDVACAAPTDSSLRKVAADATAYFRTGAFTDEQGKETVAKLSRMIVDVKEKNPGLFVEEGQMPDVAQVIDIIGDIQAAFTAQGFTEADRPVLDAAVNELQMIIDSLGLDLNVRLIVGDVLVNDFNLLTTGAHLFTKLPGVLTSPVIKDLTSSLENFGDAHMSYLDDGTFLTDGKSSVQWAADYMIAALPAVKGESEAIDGDDPVNEKPVVEDEVDDTVPGADESDPSDPGNEDADEDTVGVVKNEDDAEEVTSSEDVEADETGKVDESVEGTESGEAEVGESTPLDIDEGTVESVKADTVEKSDAGEKSTSRTLANTGASVSGIVGAGTLLTLIGSALIKRRKN